MNNDDVQLEQLLNSLEVVQPSTHLSERIITQARLSEPLPESVFRQIWNGLVIPRPSYALAFSLLLGVLVGWQSPSMLNAEQSLIEDELNNLFYAEVSLYE